MKHIFIAAGIFFAGPLFAENVEISNGIVTASAADKGDEVYKGVRFDRAGIISALEANGHSYFGKIMENAAVERHDNITGAPEEFANIDISENGGRTRILKIGVGIIERPTAEPYNFRITYPLVDAGVRSVRVSADSIEYAHEVSSPEGYAYVYKKTLRLPKGESALLIEHSLINKGTKPIDTTVYDHNFFIIDKTGTCPDISVKVPFKLEGEADCGMGDIAVFDGCEIKILRCPEGEQRALVRNIKTPQTVEGYDIKIKNAKTGGAVRITCDRPAIKMFFWCSRATYCPEPFIAVNAACGKEFKWRYRYEFFSEK